jgi:hypothetical protein
MFKITSKTPVLFKRTLTSALLGLFTIATILYGGFVVLTPQVHADSNSTINFQARLQSAAGAVVPDGYYNVQFKLYSASSGGSALWTETYYDSNGATAGNDNRVRVVNGYVSVALGSQTAFPGTINWDQDLYMTMNIGGVTQTATPTYDGEMNPRLHLTGVPYAFKAGQLAQHNNTNGYDSTLSIIQPTGGNQVFQITDQGAAGTYTLLTQNAANTNFIQNQNVSPQTATFNINGSGTVGSLYTSTIDTAAAGTLGIGNTNATTLNIATNNAAHSINIGTGNADEDVAIGSLTSGSTTAIHGGNGLTFDVNSGQSLYFLQGGQSTFALGVLGEAIFQPRNDTNGSMLVKNDAGNTILTVRTEAVTTGSSGGYVAGSGGFSTPGGLTLSNTSLTPYTYLTPLGASLSTRINIENFNPGAYGAAISLGLPSTASLNARGIVVADARASAHQPTITVLSPDETKVAGFSWDGSNAVFRLKTTSDAAAINVNGNDLISIRDYTSTEAIMDLGLTGVRSGELAFQNANTNKFTMLKSSDSQSSSYIIALPTAAGTAGQCLSVSSVSVLTQSLGYSSCGGVNLQGSTPGTADTGNFNITGTGITGTALQTPLLDTASGVALNIGTTNATVINLNQNTAVAANKSLNLGANSTMAFGSGTGSFDASAATGTFGTTTGANNLNGNTTVASGKTFTAQGTALFKNGTNSTAAFQIQTAGGSSFLTADSANSIIRTKDLTLGNPGSVQNAARNFTDGFETSNGVMWSGSNAGGASTISYPSINSGIVRSGKYSLGLANSNGVGYIYKTTTVKKFRTYFYVGSQTSTLDLMGYMTGANATGTKFVLYRTNTGAIGFFNHQSGSDTATSGTVATGGWHEIEFDITIDPTAGAAQVYMDGTQILNETGINTGSTQTQSIYLGSDVTGQGGTVYYDDVAVDVNSPDDSASLYVADTMHVAGTSSFGNDVYMQGNATMVGNTSIQGGTINIGEGGGAHTVTVGSANLDSTTLIQGGYSGGAIILTTESGGNLTFRQNGIMTFHIDSLGRANFQPLNDTTMAFSVFNSAGTTRVFGVDTGSNIVTVCATCVLQSGIVSASGHVHADGYMDIGTGTRGNYTTPLGTTIGSKIVITNDDPGSFGQLIALGIPSTSNSTSRVITLLDARTTSHQATLAILSPDETQVGGLSWDGSNSQFRVKSTTAAIAFNVDGFDAVTVRDSGSGDGVLSVGNGGSKRGQVAFMNAGNTNGAYLQAATTSSTYFTNLPTGIGTAGQCLAVSSVSSATQSLGYSSCGGVSLQGSTPGTADTGNLNITGTGIFGTAVQTALLDTASAAALNVGTTNATQINLNQNTVIASGKALTVNGTTTLQNSTDSSSAFQIKNAAGDSFVSADSLDKSLNTKNLNVGSASETSGNRLFSDGFESGDGRMWTGSSVGAGSTLAPATAHVYGGKYSEQITNGGTPAYVYKSITGAQTTTARGYVYVSSQSSTTLDILELGNVSGGRFIVSRNAGNISVYNSVTNTGYDGGTLSTGAWHEFELSVTIHATTGSIKLYLDGTQVVNQTGLNTSSSNPAYVQIGDVNTGRGGVLYIDDIAVDTVRPGDSASVNVNDNLHVGGSSSFGGDVYIQGDATLVGTTAIQGGTTNIGTTAANHTINIGTGASSQTNVAIGNQIGSSATTIQGGTGGVTLSILNNSDLSIVQGTTTVYTVDSIGRQIWKVRADDSQAYTFRAAGGASALTIDTSSNIVSLNALQAGNGGVASSGGISASQYISIGGGAIGSYVTPGGATVNTRIKLANEDPGAFGQLIALGLPSTANASSRAISLLDARTTAHQPTLTIFSPDENQVGGFSWDGSNTVFKIKSSTPYADIQNSGGVGLSVGFIGSAQVVSVGDPGNSDGYLQLANDSNTNTARLAAPTVSASYLLNLPTAAGAAGQCFAVSSVSSSTMQMGYNNCLSDTTGVQLQSSTPGTAQTGNLNLSGTGIFGTAVSAPLFDRASAGTLDIGLNNATSVKIGGGDASTNDSPVTFVLDSKTGTGDPTGVDGAMYYNANYKRMRCYFDGQWRFCNDPAGLTWGYNVNDDFVAQSATGLFGMGWQLVVNGSGSNVAQVAADVAYRPGQVQLDTGTTTTGNANLYMNNFSGTETYWIGGGEEVEFAVNIPTLADATNNYDLRLGMCDSDGTADCTDGYYFTYDRDTSANWIMSTANNSTRTKTASSVAVGTGWHRFKIVANSAGTSLTYYVDGTSLGSVTTNIPTTSARATEPGFSIQKQASTTSRSIKVDYFQYRNSLTTPR